MPSAQKTKGKGYENAVAKYLTGVYGSKFMRVPTSGAFLGGINYDRRELMTEGQIRAFKGDIIPPDDWNYFNCECKFYKGFNFHLLYDGNKLLDGWITETLTTANPKDLNLIFMKFNNIGEYMAYEVREGFQVESYTQYTDNWHITSKSQFWHSHNINIIKNRSIGTHNGTTPHK
jgi:hypothetical protein